MCSKCKNVIIFMGQCAQSVKLSSFSWVNVLKVYNCRHFHKSMCSKSRTVDSLQNRETKSDHRIMQPFARPNTRAWPRDSVLGKILDFDPTLKIWLIRFFVHVPSPRPSTSPLVPSIFNLLCFHPCHIPLETSTFNFWIL